MVFLYTLGIRLYLILVRIASPFNPKAKQWVDGRKNLFSRLEAAIGTGNRIAWFHCASLGEFEQGRPVIEEFKQQYPDIKILVTFFSPSGYEVRKNYAGADFIFYLPIDTWRNARKFVRLVNPEVVFFVKYEFWYFMLNRLKQEGIKTYLISAIFRPDQLFFKRYGLWYRHMLRCFTHFFVQNHQSEQLLLSIGFSNVTISGDTRFDRVSQIATQAKDIQAIGTFKNGEMTIVAGSTWPKDEELLANWFKGCSTNIKMVIAPHEIGEEHIQRIVQLFEGVPTVRFTQAVQSDLANARLLILDTIGKLSSAYRYGEVAYIGGGFGTGIHNTLEAATWGKPVVFGPRYQKFKEAFDLIAGGGGFSVKSQEELSDTLNSLITTPELLKHGAQFAREYVDMKRGATGRILDAIKVN
ncbi:3-deoxy-D-manno-octulosonic acid transferase [Williamwhitmania taraxaci]|uniref:3-deoxy-D-manno-octulosonic acid transferase n=1 Tax=Williamwhitmania taraxaci TaxID=1640674 RepID=A0A1G6QY51_9BACT|nr:glycosyltransferase N-terminal domain-containing protein [Williamwhitmania taraxaci]SDC97191.1 3-deoxy-D-manno-octulosonic-acid transferase [Williamwhitmania taraxaci]